MTAPAKQTRLTPPLAPGTLDEFSAVYWPLCMRAESVARAIFDSEANALGRASDPFASFEFCADTVGCSGLYVLCTPNKGPQEKYFVDSSMLASDEAVAEAISQYRAVAAANGPSVTNWPDCCISTARLLTAFSA